jgi:hypothetical protein
MAASWFLAPQSCQSGFDQSQPLGQLLEGAACIANKNSNCDTSRSFERGRHRVEAAPPQSRDLAGNSIGGWGPGEAFKGFGGEGAG